MSEMFGMQIRREEPTVNDQSRPTPALLSSKILEGTQKTRYYRLYSRLYLRAPTREPAEPMPYLTSKSLKKVSQKQLFWPLLHEPHSKIFLSRACLIHDWRDEDVLNQ